MVSDASRRIQEGPATRGPSFAKTKTSFKRVGSCPPGDSPVVFPRKDIDSKSARRTTKKYRRTLIIKSSLCQCRKIDALHLIVAMPRQRAIRPKPPTQRKWRVTDCNVSLTVISVHETKEAIRTSRQFQLIVRT